MSIIWCGGEALDFRNNTSGSISVVYSTYNRTDYSRISLSVTNGKTYISNTFTPVSSGTWIHCAFESQNTNAMDAQSFLFSLRNSTTGDAIGFGMQDYKFSIGKRTSAGTITWFATEAAKTISPDIHMYDIYVEDYSASGAMHFYVDGKLVLSYSGDITVGSTLNFDQVQLKQGSVVWGAFFSEIIVADEDTRLMSLKTLAPNAAGDTNDWNGAYTDIDEYEISDADLIETTSVDQDVQFNLTGMPAGNFVCRGVKVIARVADGIGNRGIQMGVKTNSTVYLRNTISLDTVWDQKEELFLVNPVTTISFTPDEINALQIAFRSKSN